MLHSFAEIIAVFLYCEKDEYPVEVYTYGMELIISSAVETVILAALGLLLNRLGETIVFISAFSALRFYTGGYHAETYLRCGVVTVVTYLSVIFGFLLLQKYSSERLTGMIIILVFSVSLWLICKLAPVEHRNKRIENRKKLRRISLVILGLEFVLTLTGLFSGFSYLLVIIPTVLSVDVLILTEIIRKGGDKDG